MNSNNFYVFNDYILHIVHYLAGVALFSLVICVLFQIYSDWPAVLQ